MKVFLAVLAALALVVVVFVAGVVVGGRLDDSTCTTVGSVNDRAGRSETTCR